MISIKKISKKFNGTIVFKNLSLKIIGNSITVIFGPNGCGKTTLLRCIAGLEDISSGKIEIDKNKKLTFAFQNPQNSIFPWLNNLENLTIHLDKNKKQKEKILLDFLRNLKFDINLKKYPYQLSGGQQQQLVILRSLLNNPDMILMDEPFKSLDVNTLSITKKSLLDYIKKQKITLLLTTHDLDEALLFATDLIIVSNRPMKILAHIKISFKKRDENLMSSKEFLLKRKQVLSILNKHQIQ